MFAYVTEKGFEVWAKNSYESLNKVVIGNTEPNTPYCNVVAYYNKANNVAMIVNTVTGRVAKAKIQSTSNEADEAIGFGIAWARYLNKPIPTVVSKITTVAMLSVGDRFGFLNEKKGFEFEVVGYIRTKCKGNVLAVKAIGTDIIYTIDQIIATKDIMDAPICIL